ncbi:MAG: rod shape-determining protein MreD [Candidatus Omnitrophica bacterium]|nr:rod shape-determining protein MreD [Candidatus Omnitrophota bacterium]MBU4487992.1 rod shape-determining protein MreD [Candidatus Omnitrophota bacterium]MCG2704765.1 rod shape-determining protein MreD [Candidatus Omnitrophota bacterium]
MYKINRLRDYSLILLAFFLQVSLANSLSLFGAKPSFPIILAVFFALFTDERYGFETAFFAGILLDIFSLRLFGLNTILFSIVGYFIGRFNTKIYRESMATHAILIFLSTIFILSAYRFFLCLENRFLLSNLSFSFVFSPSTFLSAIYNSFLGILIYTFLSRVFNLGETSIL